MEEVTEKTQNANGLELVVGTALVAVHRPAKLLLPLYGFFYGLLVMSGERGEAGRRSGLAWKSVLASEPRACCFL